MSAVNFEEINNLTGELLPERAVLSAFGGGGYGGGDGGATVVSTCTTQSTSPALVAGLPVGTQQITQICTPATVAH
ncbi:hypothetical protein ACFVYD_27345 [Streptomyces sp. NPDC058301]|uniref:hypothetical protein n=1 Tax=Streptomyces sp. NPDC058301 TaxID=3346436 RepID=UPI0036EA7A0B